MTFTPELILTATCCLQTSIRGAFIDTLIPTPKHVFVTDKQETPFCLCHSFGSVRYLGSQPYGLNGQPSDCLTGYDETFEIIVGVCAPMPASVRAMRGQICSDEEIYGECPPCGKQLEIQAPPSGGDCVKPVLNDKGEFDWPETYNQTWSMTSFAGYLLVQRMTLRSRFLKVFCQCFNACNEDMIGKAKFSILSTEPWDDGQFQGTRMVVVGNIG